MKNQTRPLAKFLFAGVTALLLNGGTDGTAQVAAPKDANSPPAKTVETTPAQTDPAKKDEDAETPVESAGPKLVEAPLNLSAGLPEIIKLAQARVGDDVLIAYIEKTGAIFNPSVDEILYLNDLGVSQAVITSLVRHTKKADPALVQAAEKVGSPAKADAAVTGPAPAAPVAEAATQTVQTVPAPVPPAITTAPQEVQHFYSDLAPYGNWVYVSDYGWSWQPAVAVVDVGWRPYYSRGRWLWSNHGWYWQSDYSWGWAAFHHGRWYRHHRYGWCWTPDLVWGPSWVSWRYADAHCGWAPLPPSARFRSGIGLTFHNSSVGLSFDFGLGYDSYCYVPTRYFCEPDPWRYGLSRHHGRNVHNHTTVVNNYTVNNTTIINNGVGFNRISSASRNEIRRVEVRTQSGGERTSVRPDRVVPSGSSLAVYRPPEPGTKTAPGRSSSSEVRRPGSSTLPASRSETSSSLTPRTSTARPTESTSRPGSGSTVSKSTEPARPGAVLTQPRPSRTETESSRPTEPTRPNGYTGRSTDPRLTTPSPVPSTQRPTVSTLPERSEPPRSSLDTGTTPRPSPSRTLTPPTSPVPSTTVRTPPTIPTAPQVVAPPRPTTPSRPEVQRPVESFNRPSEVRRPTVSTPSAPAARPSFENRSISPSSPSIRSSPAPSYSAPAPRSSPGPSYSAPSRPAPSYSSPGPSYSAPRSSEPSRPSYSAPGRSYGTPTPSAPSSSGRSGSTVPPVNNGPPPTSRERR